MSIQPHATPSIQADVAQSMHLIRLGVAFDARDEPALEAAVLRVQEEKGRHVILDMEALLTLDSRGMGKLFLTYHHLHRHHIRMSIINPRPAVLELLKFVNFPRIVPVFETLEDAIAWDRDRKTSPSLSQAI